MAKEIFKNLPDKTTPLSATKLNGLFDGAESMGSIVVEDVTCKNILPTDVGNWEQGAISNGVNGTSTTRIRTNCFIPIKADTEYYVSVQNKNYSFLNIHYYDTNKNFVTDAYNSYSQINGATGLAIKTPSGVAFARVVLRNADNTTTITASEVSSIKPMIEKGSVGTNYVEHQDFSNKQHYSTTEQVIGTWIDGKPLYRKVINIDSLPNNANKNYDTGLTHGTHSIKNFYGCYTNGQYDLGINEYSGSNYIRTVIAFALNIQITTNSDKSSYSGFVVIEYTKTTD